MNPDKNKPDPLDDLLQSAEWPDLSDQQRDRLLDKWQGLLEAELTPRSVDGRQAKQVSFVRSLIAIAAILLVGCALWLFWRANNTGAINDPSIASNNESTTKKIGVNRNLEMAKRTGTLPQGEHLQFLARASTKRKSVRKLSFTQWMVQKGATTIGRDPNLSEAFQRLVHFSDQTIATLSSEGDISRTTRRRYLELRSGWEKWAWRASDRASAEDEVAMTRFALAVSSTRSMHRFEAAVEDDALAAMAAKAIVWMGDTSDLDRAIARAVTPEAQRMLLSALIERPGRQSALRYMAYINHPQTRALAIEVAEMSTQLPAQFWLEAIASRDPVRWEAAIALSQLCDPRVVDTLIQMTMHPDTVRPAMVALANSQCSHAQEFCAIAANNYQLASQLNSAKRRLQRIHDAQLELEHNQYRGL